MDPPELTRTSTRPTRERPLARKSNGSGKRIDTDLADEGFRESVNGQHNMGDLGARLAETIQAIEAQDAKIQKLAEAHKRACTPIREEIRRIKKLANEAGLHATPLNAVLRQRKLEAQAAHVADSMDEEQADEFRVFSDALHDFWEKEPLGQATLAREAANTP
jgi:hypothetical protein